MKFKKFVLIFVFVAAICSTLLNVLYLFGIIPELASDVGLGVVFLAAILFAVDFMRTKAEDAEDKSREKPDSPFSNAVGISLMLWLISFIFCIVLL